MPKTTLAQEEQNKPFELVPNTLAFEDTDRKHGFVVLDKLVLYAANLSRDAKILYAYLLGYAYEKDHCFPGYAVLCADLQASENTVRKAMRELEAASLLLQKRQGLGKPNIYTLLSLSKAKIILQEHHQSRTSKFEVLEPQKTILQEHHGLRSNKKELKEVRNEEYISKDEKKEQEHYVNIAASAIQPEEDITSMPAISNGTRKRGRPRKTQAGNGNEQETEYKPKVEEPQKAALTSARRRTDTPQQPVSMNDALQQYTKLGLSPAFLEEALPTKDEQWHDLKTFFYRGFAIELHDEANITSTVTRAYNLFKRTQEHHPDFDFSAFVSLMYEAKSITQERSGSIKKKNEHGFTTKMAYFFAVLEDKLGFKQEKRRRAD